MTDTKTKIRTTVTAYLAASPARDAIEFYKRAFGATEQFCLEPDEQGRIGYATISIGETTLALSDEWPEMNVKQPKTLGGYSVSFVIEVDDADRAFERAVAAGAAIERPLKDEPYGRAGWLIDPFGHRWCINTPDHQHPHD